MAFEWDENKRLSNIKKHGLDFVNACYIFNDVNLTYILDNRQYYTEERFLVIGIDKNGIIRSITCVIYEETIRIISFRSATKKEKEFYYGN